jgi:hypothetical protein
MPVRKPRGYDGEEHSTLGSDILAGLKILRLPEQVLGKTEADRLRHVRADGWYPVEWLFGLMEILEAHVGKDGLLQMGRRIFELSHRQRILATAVTARDILYAVDGMYHHTNRGRGIGGWKVLSFGDGVAKLETNTMHHCIVEQGLLMEGLLAVGCACTVQQTQCFRDGADTCVFEITSAFVDKRWSGDIKR